MTSLPESLTENFYRWEKRGRGWRVWDDPVELEPPFEPFFHRYSSAPVPAIDDGRKLTRVGSFIQKMKANFAGQAQQTNDYLETEMSEAEPEYFYDSFSLTEIQISLRPDQKITKETSEQFILSLSSLSRPASFEIIGTQSSIVVQIVCREPDSRVILSQLKAYFPESVISVSRDYLKQHWTEEAESVVID